MARGSLQGDLTFGFLRETVRETLADETRALRDPEESPRSGIDRAVASVKSGLRERAQIAYGEGLAADDDDLVDGLALFGGPRARRSNLLADERAGEPVADVLRLEPAHQRKRAGAEDHV